MNNTTLTSRLTTLFSASKRKKQYFVRDELGKAWSVVLSPEKHSLEPISRSFVDAGLFPSQSTITYTLKMPKLSPSDTLLAIAAYVEEQMGEDIVYTSSLVYLEQKKGRGKEKRVTAVIAKNSEIEMWVDQHKNDSIRCRWYFPKQLCLQRFVEAYCREEPSLYVVDRGSTEITLLHLQDNSLVACRTIPLLKEAQGTDSRDFSSTIQSVLASLLSWPSQPSETPPTLLLTGQYANENEKEEWKAQLQKALHCSILEPTQNKQYEYDQASLVGAALLSEPSLFGAFPPAFASAEKTPYLGAWKKAGALALLLSCATTAFFYYQDQSKEKALKLEIEEELADVIKMPWTQSIKALLPKNVDRSRDAVEAIEKVQAEIKKQALFPLKPALPTFSEVLSWLSHSVHKIQHDNETLDIQKISYTFVQYPTLDAMQKHYQLRLDVEFTTPHAQLARSFHDLLLSSGEMVDLRNGVKWNVSAGTYKTTFFIKDTTKYSTLM